MAEIPESPLTRVKQLRFSDLYLGHPVLGNRFADVPGAPANPVIAGPELREDLDALTTLCKKGASEASTGTDFKVSHDDVDYRVSVMRAIGGDVFVMRRMSSSVSTLSDLGIPIQFQSVLLKEHMTGLLLISGAMKSGKTSTACSLVRERLLKYGGVAVTAEDPIELPLEGEHGSGVCFQTYASGPGGFAESARHIVRWGAKIILLGEIRDGEVAAEALRAGVNGHLVISTIHTDSVPAAMRRLQALASETFDTATANSLLADGLAGVFHQKLSGDPRRLSATEILMVRGEDSVMSAIRNNQFERLGSEMNMQMANLIHSGGSSSRKVA